jgi:hypothetical protein
MQQGDSFFECFGFPLAKCLFTYLLPIPSYQLIPSLNYKHSLISFQTLLDCSISKLPNFSFTQFFEINIFEIITFFTNLPKISSRCESVMTCSWRKDTHAASSHVPVFWILDFNYIPLYIHVQLTTCLHNSDMHKTRLAPNLRTVSSSVTSSRVCTITVTGGEMSDVGQTVQPSIIELTVLTVYLYHKVLKRPFSEIRHFTWNQ